MMIVSMDALQRLQATLHNQIPLSRTMGLAVGAYDNGCLTLHAPLKPNINDKDTAFAGSLNALVTLTGWSLTWLVLDSAALHGEIVIQDSTIQYLRPVTRDFVARSCLPEANDVTRFLTLLRRRGLARLELQAEIHEAGVCAVSFSGRYVVQMIRNT
jgi:thioesterase domain-containing protein